MGILKRIRKGIAKRFKNWKNSLFTTTSTKTQVRASSGSIGISKEEEKQKLLEMLDMGIAIEHSDGREETHTTLTYAISRKDNRAVREVLKLYEENGIVEDILDKKITIKRSDGKEVTYPPLIYAQLCGSSEIVEEISKVAGESVKETTTEQQPAVVIGTATNIECDENSLRNETAVMKTVIQASTENDNTKDQCSKPGKENAVNEREEASTKVMQQRQAVIFGSVGAVLLVIGIASYLLQMHIIAVIGGIAGLACIGIALYSALNPNTKLEKVEKIEQLDEKSLSGPTTLT